LCGREENNEKLDIGNTCAGARVMEMSYVTLLLFVTFSSLRIISYFPQIYRVATDGNGASAISYSTWALWVGANVSTALYASVNLQDLYLASVSILYAVCCVVVIVLTVVKRRLFRSRIRGKTGRATNRATEMAIEAMAIEALHLADAMRAQERSNPALRRAES
jgi:uncharacterized membrane protein (DUF2068 family)